MNYNISDKELSELVSKYSIRDIIDGKVKGKGSSKIRYLTNRIEAIQEKICQGDYTFADLAYVNMRIEEKQKARYWKKKLEDINDSFKLEDVLSTDQFVEYTVNKYRIKDDPILPIKKQVSPDIYQTVARTTRNILFGVALLGVGLAGGYFLGKSQNKEQIPIVQTIKKETSKYSPITEAYAEPTTKTIVPQPAVKVAQESAKQSLESSIQTAIQEQDQEQTTSTSTINYGPNKNKIDNIRHKIELARLNHDEFTVSEYQKQLDNLIKNKVPKEPKKEISKDKPKIKNKFDLDDWAKDILSPFRFDKLLFKGKEGRKEYLREFLIFGKDSYHREHPIKAVCYDISAYTIGNGISNLVSGGKVSTGALIGEGPGGLSGN